jgi:hypothetical protein
MQETEEYPIVEVTDVYDKTTLDQYLRSYKKLHGFIPYQKVTGIMEDKNGQEVYCQECFIGDVSGKYFVVAHESGNRTLRVPEHGSITVILDPQEE